MHLRPVIWTLLRSRWWINARVVLANAVEDDALGHERPCDVPRLGVCRLMSRCVLQVGFGSCCDVLAKGALVMSDSTKRQATVDALSRFALIRAIFAVPRVHLSARRLATITEVPASTSSPTPSNASAQPQKTRATPEGKPIIRSGVVLNRHPILTRTPTPLESAYYAYHSRIQRALHNPFPSEFYFKPGSLLQGKFEEEEMKREREAFGRMPWLESSSKKSAPTSDILNQDDAVTPMPRESEADRTGDVKSLDRKGERNLYLLVMNKGDGAWRFPQTDLVGDELLHEVSDLVSEVKSNFHYRTYSGSAKRSPVIVRGRHGYLARQSYTNGCIPYHSVSRGAFSLCSGQSAISDPYAWQNYTFFYKAHILQGQVRPDGKEVADFAWLTKEEIQPRVDKHYWSGVKDMLSDF